MTWYIHGGGHKVPWFNLRGLNCCLTLKFCVCIESYVQLAKIRHPIFLGHPVQQIKFLGYCSLPKLIWWKREVLEFLTQPTTPTWYRVCWTHLLMIGTRDSITVSGPWVDNPFQGGGDKNACTTYFGYILVISSRIRVESKAKVKST